MSKSIFAAIMFCGICLLGVRCFAWGWMSSSLSKEWKRYKKSATRLDRWFFLSFRKEVKAKFSKSEGRIINYPVIVSYFRLINGIMHLLYALLLICSAFVAITGRLSSATSVLNAVFVLYGGAALLSFLLYACIEFYVRKRYHRERMRWRKR